MSDKKGGIMIGGRGTGKTAFSEVILNTVSDGDLTTNMGNIEYSTLVREIVTVEDMINYAIRNGEFL